jgi:hypothetical protein
MLGGGGEAIVVVVTDAQVGSRRPGSVVRRAGGSHSGIG